MAGGARCGAADSVVWRGASHFRSLEFEAWRCAIGRNADGFGQGPQGTQRAGVAAGGGGAERVCGKTSFHWRAVFAFVLVAAGKTDERARGARLDATAARAAGPVGKSHPA